MISNPGDVFKELILDAHNHSKTLTYIHTFSAHVYAKNQQRTTENTVAVVLKKTCREIRQRVALDTKTRQLLLAHQGKP